MKKFCWFLVLEGLVFDLRNNFGGLLDISLEVASLWIGGETMAIQKSRSEKKKYLKFKPLEVMVYPPLPIPIYTPFKDIETVVLVNKMSASASEIVAGAFQDYQKGTIIEETTYGKVSVQQLFFLPGGSILRLTTSKWLTPKERTIHKIGIKPDIEVIWTDEDFEKDSDPELEKAIEFLENSYKESKK